MRKDTSVSNVEGVLSHHGLRLSVLLSAKLLLHLGSHHWRLLLLILLRGEPGALRHAARLLLLLLHHIWPLLVVVHRRGLGVHSDWDLSRPTTKIQTFSEIGSEL